MYELFEFKLEGIEWQQLKSMYIINQVRSNILDPAIICIIMPHY